MKNDTCLDMFSDLREAKMVVGRRDMKMITFTITMVQQDLEKAIYCQCLKELNTSYIEDE